MEFFLSAILVRSFWIVLGEDDLFIDSVWLNSFQFSPKSLNN